MAETNRFAKFVSQKINKIRWRPVTNEIVQHGTYFCTGSWDNDINKVCMWALEDRSSADDEESLRRQQQPTVEVEPKLLCQAVHRGDVTELVYLPNDVALVSSSNGSVQFYKHDTERQILDISHGWDGLHHHGSRVCPCTALAVKGCDTFASAGEDGRLCFVNMEQQQHLRIIEKADSCTINAACFTTQSEVGTVNSIGQLKVWDMRQASDEPARLFLPTGDMTALHCLDKHPTQPHIVCTGGQDGALTVWDMRQDKFPVTVLQAHSADMWEVRFHPTHPDSLLTCSEDGSAWHWDASSMNTAPRESTIARDFSLLANASHLTTPSVTGHNTTSLTGKSLNYTSPWLASEASKHRMDITDLLTGNTMPVNSLDIQGTTLLCGTDGEQIYSVCSLAIR